MISGKQTGSCEAFAIKISIDSDQVENHGSGLTRPLGLGFNAQISALRLAPAHVSPSAWGLQPSSPAWNLTLGNLGGGQTDCMVTVLWPCSPDVVGVQEALLSLRLRH